MTKTHTFQRTGFPMQALPAEPSFSVLHATLGRQSMDGTHMTMEAVLTGVDAFVPFVGIIPRLVIRGVHNWEDKKHKKIRHICKRFQDLHDKANKAMQDKRVTQQWVDKYEALILEFIVFAAAYEKVNRMFARVTRRITSEDDQRTIAKFVDRVDDLFFELECSDKAQDTNPAKDMKDAEDDDCNPSDSTSTAASSP